MGFGGDNGRRYERAFPLKNESTSSWCETHKRKKLMPDVTAGTFKCNVCDFLQRKGLGDASQS